MSNEYVEKVKGWLSREDAELFDFSVEGNYVILRPREYLGKDKFSLVIRIIRDNGGDYVSKGEASHFRVPIGIEPPMPKSGKTRQVSIPKGGIVKSRDKPVELQVKNRGLLKVRRKFSLNRINKSYESLDIEVEGNTMEECILEIEGCWRLFCQRVVEGKVQ